MAKKTYSVITAIEHNNERYEAGSQIDLDDKHAEPLYAVGAISAPQEPAEDESSGKGKKTKG